MFHPTIGSGFSRLQTDLGDTRLNAFLLEHGWLWLTGRPGVQLWSPSIFYPSPNALAFGDLMLSFAPLYWPWRLLGFGQVLSFQLWMICVAVCNFLVCFSFLRRCAGFDRLGSALGSFVISFAASRIGQLGHQQMLPIFFVIGALWSVWSLVAAAEASKADCRRPWAVAVLFGCLVAQFYGSYYNFVFASAILVATVLLALVAPTSRRILANLLRGNWRVLLAASCGALLLALPAACHYLEAAGLVGVRRPGSAFASLPRLASYLLVSGRSWWYGWMSELPPMAGLTNSHEHAIGLGFITTGCMVWVGWKTRSRPAVRLAIAVMLLLGLLVTHFPGGIRLWTILHQAYPPFQAIRAVSRIGMLLAIPAGIAIGWLVSHRNGGIPGRVVLLAAALACLEQGVTTQSVEVSLVEARVREVAERLDPSTEVFFVVPKGGGRKWAWYQLDAMWAQQRTGVPTINGYGGNRPPGWGFRDLSLSRAGDLKEMRRRLDFWADQMGIDAARIQTLVVKSSINSPVRDGGVISAPPSQGPARPPKEPAGARGVNRRPEP